MEKTNLVLSYVGGNEPGQRVQEPLATVEEVYVLNNFIQNLVFAITTWQLQQLQPLFQLYFYFFLF